MLDVMSLSETATLDRFNAAQDRVAKDFGYGSTAGALKITKDYVEVLSSFVEKQLSNLHSSAGSKDHSKELLRIIRHLSPEAVALTMLHTALGCVALDKPHLQTCLSMGYAIASEAWAAKLLSDDPKLSQKIEKAATKRHGNLKYRKQAAKSAAARAGYRQKNWGKATAASAGGLLVTWLLQALPDVFVTYANGEGYGITAKTLEAAEAAVEQTLRRNPVFLPCVEPPQPWTDVGVGGYWDERTRLSTQIVRVQSGRQETLAAVRGAMKDGSMKPAVDAVNALQSVAFTINERVLEVVKWAYEHDVPVEGLPPRKDVPGLPKLPDHEWKGMSDEAKRLRKYRSGQIKEHNRSLLSNRVLFQQDMRTAGLLRDAGRFWTPLNCDWRGRVYAVPHFNFQRDDRVRALFSFADGLPIGAEGLYWLKIHVANCGDFGKISKRPLQERVEWVEKHMTLIQAVASDPRKLPEMIGPTLGEAWRYADQPFLFLAACMEMADACRFGPGYLTRVPVSFDGSCSGLQHLCAMTRANEGALVNLTSSPEAQDVYQLVADAVIKLVTEDANAGHPLAEQWLALGITRSTLKRNVMTYSYSSKRAGMSQQLRTDVMKPLRHKVLSGELSVHPFGEDEGWVAAHYLAGHVYNSIVGIVQTPAQAMGFLQKLARALAHEGKPLRWTTPVGIPWTNRYHEPVLKRLKLWLNDVSVRVTVADGDKKEINKDKAANGVAPNFVHALDAAHLMLVANACFSENITQIATVHDSFGCLAPQAARFNAIIREQFRKMYEDHDVLEEALASAKHDLTVHNWERLPEVPEYGTLNLREVENAVFAFA